MFPKRPTVARAMAGRWLIAVAVGAFAVAELRDNIDIGQVASAFAESPAQPVKPKGASAMEIVRNCPAGHRIEFAFPVATLYLDIHWLGSGTIIDLFNAYGINCPSSPVTAREVELGESVLRVLDLHNGLDVSRLYVSGNHSPPYRRRPAPARSTEHHSGPWIEDDTNKGMLKAIPSLRSYRLYYPNASGGRDGTIQITCSGELGHRACGTTDLYASSTFYDPLYVTYHLSQSKLPAPAVSELYPTDPTTEPGALLQFNVRFHEWLETLKKP
jgi:hypothetical protein